MGIRGLETFIDQFYRSKIIREKVFAEKSLKNLNLLIDGNQVPYLIHEIYQIGHYGGQYDFIYGKMYEIFKSLKPFIGIVIFNGSSTNLTKSISKLDEKVKKLGSIQKRQKNQMNNQEENGLIQFKQMPSILAKSVFIDVLNELQIDFLFADESSTNCELASLFYSNGFNDTSTCYTALSKDSYFYVYKIKTGFVSFKYVRDLFMNPEKINGDTIVPVFEAERLMKYLEFKNYKTWLFFCLIMGDYNLDIDRNQKYIKLNNILDQKNDCSSATTNEDQSNSININTSRIREHEHKSLATCLIDHLRQNEEKLIRFDYISICCTYRPHILLKLKDIIDKFQFNDQKISIGYLGKTSSFYDHYLRLLLTNSFRFITCYVEDYTQESVYECVRRLKLNEYLYYILFQNRLSVSDENNQKKTQSILEYYRCKLNGNASMSPLFHSTEIIMNADFMKSFEQPTSLNSLVYNLDRLFKKNRSNAEINVEKTSGESVDDLTLLFVSLAFWINWIKRDSEKKSNTIHSDLYLKSFITNVSFFFIKEAFSSQSTNQHAFEDNRLSSRSLISRIKTSINQIKEDEEFKCLKEFCNLYRQSNEQFLKFNLNEHKTADSKEELENYLKNDLQIVHRINEFQMIYKSIALINISTRNSQLHVISPKCFLNGWFICKYIQSSMINSTKSLNQAEIKVNQVISLCSRPEMRIFNSLCSQLMSIYDEINSALITI